MAFTEKELALIEAARKKSADAATKRWLLLAAILIVFALMLTGYVDSRHFAYFAVAAVLFAIAMPQFGGGPQYEDLVQLLQAKAKANNEA